VNYRKLVTMYVLMAATTAVAKPATGQSDPKLQYEKITLPNGLVVAAIVAVNAVGDIIDPATGKVVAGVRNPDNTFADARTILVLHHLDGRGLGEIAAVLGIPVGTAKSRLFAARKALERSLERER